MAIIKRDPFSGSLMANFDDMFEKMGTGFSFSSGMFNPAMDVIEDENCIKLEFEVPGMKKDDVKVSVNNEGLLLIKGERKQVEEDKSKTYLRRERVYGSFEKSFRLSDAIDSDHVEAKFNDGVLEIVLNKKEPVQPKEIEVAIN